MSATAIQPAADNSDGLRLVLFGLPGAGKSSLLGALAQAGQTQEQALNARIVDRSNGLAELQKGLAQGRSQQTVQEVTAYPVTFEPLPFPGKHLLPVSAVLIDCAGRAANDILARQKPLDGWQARGSLAQEVQAADTLVLVADAAADAPQLQRDFGQFAAFLRLFEHSRAKRNDVAGLPVYLVLSKCDLLAKKTDTASAWMQRIEERKRQVEQGFQKFLAQKVDREGLAFGKIDVHVCATAARRPALADRPANPQEPYGVAELFRQCLQAAAVFHQRRLLAARRLKMTLAGIGGLVSLMLLLALGVYLTRPSAEVTALENALHSLLPAEAAKPAERLKEPLDDKLKKLQKIQKNSAFDQLPRDRRDQVAGYIEEIEAYRKYNEEFLKKVHDPRFVSRAEDLTEIENRLARMSLPADYAAAWKDTRVGRRTGLWLNDIKVLRQEIAKTETWINDRIQQGRKLEKEGFALLGKEAVAKEREAWFAKYQEYREWQHRPGDRLPGASAVTYETVYRFESLDRAKKGWEAGKERLKAVFNLLQEPP